MGLQTASSCKGRSKGQYICTVAVNQRRWPFSRCSCDAVAVQSGWIDTKNMDLMHEYPRILRKFMKPRNCNKITTLPHKRPKSSEITRFQNFSDCSNRLILLRLKNKPGAQRKRVRFWEEERRSERAATMAGAEGLAFLRKSHGGCSVPPARCQEPPFKSFR